MERILSLFVFLNCLSREGGVIRNRPEQTVFSLRISADKTRSTLFEGLNLVEWLGMLFAQSNLRK